MSRLLVVAGEGSGDALAAPVVATLGTGAFGMGGPRLARAGADLLVDQRRVAVMGVPAALTSVATHVLAGARILRETDLRRPQAALLVGYSEFNGWLAPRLRRRGVPVLWYAPPQVWAWRPARARRLAPHVDALALLLPFEAPIWERAGARATYVGHPGVPRDLPVAGPRSASDPIRLALLPGSRRQEVHAHLPALLDAIRALGSRATARLVLAEGLSAGTATWIAERARGAGVTLVREPIATLARDVDVAVVASGTATLETVALGLPTVIVYRTDPLTYAVAKRWVRVPHIGLPNLVLGRVAFPELVQSAVTPERLVREVLAAVPEREKHLAACRELRSRLLAGLDDRAPAERVAEMLSPWLR